VPSGASHDPPGGEQRSAALPYAGHWEWLAQRGALHMNRRFVDGKNVAGPVLGGDKVVATHPAVQRCVIDRVRAMLARRAGVGEESCPVWRRLAWESGVDAAREALDQVTINSYEAGVGIAPHVDAHGPFGDVIVSLSLASTAVMVFTPHGSPSRAVNVLLPRRGLTLMTGAARYAFTHGIPSRSVDVLAGGTHVPNGELLAGLLPYDKSCAVGGCVGDGVGVSKRTHRLSITVRSVKVGSPRCERCMCAPLCDATQHTPTDDVNYAPGGVAVRPVV
jgi:hypothetical protein